MPEHPRQPHPLPPLRRDYEGSRLEAQQIISAYERVVPVAGQLTKPQHARVNAGGCLSALKTIQPILKGVHQ